MDLGSRAVFFHYHETPHGGLLVAVFFMNEGQVLAELPRLQKCCGVVSSWQ
jgi:hypothetical protein